MDDDEQREHHVLARAPSAIPCCDKKERIAKVHQALTASQRLDLGHRHGAVDSLGHDVSDDEGGEPLALLDLCQQLIRWVARSV
ncbi:MAG TPA: hypothetical protein VFR19_06235 [Hyphomicrobiaceae bacterium]|nr:hypothetical protein [Hyphomicrobiaceae bacterium]